MPLPSGPLMTNEQTQNNVSVRVQKAMEELAAKGEAQRQAKEMAARQAELDAAAAAEAAEIEAIRQARIQRMKQERSQAEKNTAKGHGVVSSITQDEFLATVLESARCIVHFYHSQFEQCQVMDAHLAKLAPGHLETRFCRIDAEKAPFFVERLCVRVLPSLVLFEDGKAIGRQVGFAGLGEGPQVLGRLEAKLVECGIVEATRLVAEDEEDEDDDNTKSVVAGTRRRDKAQDW